ncbi:plasmid replication initiator protein [Phytohabitans sp. ZYX-F-186]|uniref:Plasmid replication initiator protein n=1 Tax=Phytohabitans maris TaxID=3071409 RepID=A0ABU0ZT73_9ACTN|nr:replication initiator [Phytohabitans sp. ZYX-F-186]MDQ7910219.1 plasmid replication initiator protein [Phytohabitans sp. ZYX-F-186]
MARTTRPDYHDWLTHVRPAAGCIRPIRLAGTTLTLEAGTGRVLATMDTAGMPDGVILKPCGNRRATVCPTCSKRYQRDAYQVVRSGLIGGKGVPEHVATHPAVFPTLTAPSFGQVHTRHVKRHTCESRRRCDCRPEPCHPRRDAPICPHGTPLVCYARHEETDRRLGTALCPDCYDYDAQVVWNVQAGELWRRTTIAVNRHLHRLTRARGIPDIPDYYLSRGKVRIRWKPPFRLSFGKAAEMQRRGVVHFHGIVRLDGNDPTDPTRIIPPPPAIDADDLKAAIDHAARTVTFTTNPHPARPEGWQIGWGDQILTKVITVTGRGEITDAQVAAYVAKYATKSTEATGHTSARLTDDTVNLYADGDGTHTERLIEACWQLGQPRDWRRLRRWAHMLGFGGHFLTKSRRYSVTFTILRQQRITYRRTQTSGPEQTTPGEQPTTLVVNFLQFVGTGWHTTADALLANTSAALAREHQPEQLLTPT